MIFIRKTTSGGKGFRWISNNLHLDSTDIHMRSMLLRATTVSSGLKSVSSAIPLTYETLRQHCRCTQPVFSSEMGLPRRYDLTSMLRRTAFHLSFPSLSSYTFFRFQPLSSPRISTNCITVSLGNRSVTSACYTHVTEQCEASGLHTQLLGNPVVSDGQQRKRHARRNGRPYFSASRPSRVFTLFFFLQTFLGIERRPSP
jgi:hypothetical protein